MRLDDEILEELNKRISVAFASVCLSFAAMSSAMRLLTISVEKCGEVLAKNAERFEEHEPGSN